eukprot:284815703_2
MQQLFSLLAVLNVDVSIDALCQALRSSRNTVVTSMVEGLAEVQKAAKVTVGMYCKCLLDFLTLALSFQETRSRNNTSYLVSMPPKCITGGPDSLYVLAQVHQAQQDAHSKTRGLIRSPSTQLFRRFGGGKDTQGWWVHFCRVCFNYLFSTFFLLFRFRTDPYSLIHWFQDTLYEFLSKNFNDICSCTGGVSTRKKRLTKGRRRKHLVTEGNRAWHVSVLTSASSGRPRLYFIRSGPIGNRCWQD